MLIFVQIINKLSRYYFKNRIITFSLTFHGKRGEPR